MIFIAKIMHPFARDNNGGNIGRPFSTSCCGGRLCRAGDQFEVHKYIFIWKHDNAKLIAAYYAIQLDGQRSHTHKRGNGLASYVTMGVGRGHGLVFAGRSKNGRSSRVPANHRWGQCEPSPARAQAEDAFLRKSPFPQLLLLFLLLLFIWRH